MVAIVSGNGFGLSTGSSSTLGQAGVFGNPNLGNNTDGAYVNVANGNLVLQNQDDFIASLGVNLSLTRTYNSQGSFNNGYGPSWRMGVIKQITDLSGSVNTAGSTITRVNSDGSRELYRYDAARSQYISTDGGGGYNHLSLNASQEWVWTNDRSDMAGIYENYGTLAAGGYIQSSGDQMGVRISYQYDGSGRLSQATDASGDVTRFDYINGNLSQIRVTSQGGATSTRVHYTYDALNRLSQVITDLTPDDNSIGDGKVYTTSYTYLDATNEVASVTQGDGTRLAFGYKLVGGVWKVETVTDGLNQVTRYAYNGLQTTVTDPLGNSTVYGYDAAGQLLTVTAPPTMLNGAVVPGQVTTFAYDASGNVRSVTDPRGKQTTYEYDANGNRIRETNPTGDVVTRTYHPTSGLLLTETQFAINPTGVALAGASFVTRYFYDNSNRLQFIASPNSAITEYRYNASGQRTSKLEYFKDAPAVSDATTTLALLDWVLAASQAKINRTDYSYDGRGQVSKSVSYEQINGSFSSVALPSILPAGIVSKPDSVGRINSYDSTLAFTSTNQAATVSPAVAGTETLQLGSALHFKVTTPARLGAGMLSIGLNTWPADTQRLRVVFDAGLVHLQGKSGSTTIDLPLGELKANTNYIVDIVTEASGETRISVHDDGSGADTLRTQRFNFAPGSSLRFGAETASGPQYGGPTVGAANTINVTNLSTFKPASQTSAATTVGYVYDQHGQLLQTIDGNGVASALFTYDGLGRLLTSSSAATSAGIDTTVYTYDDAGGSRSVTLSSGLTTKTAYDRGGRATSVAQLDKTGSLLSRATNSYDKAGRLCKTSMLNGVDLYFLYDDAGRQQASVDANGNLTAYFYNADNQVTRTTRYARPLTPAQLSQLTPATGNWPKPSLADLGLNDNETDNRSTWSLYDDAGRLSKTVDASGTLTVYIYDQASHVTQVIRRAYDVSKLAGIYNATSIDDTATAEDQVSRKYYNVGGQLQLEVDAAGFVTEYRYDRLGQRTDALRHLYSVKGVVLNGAPGLRTNNLIIRAAGIVISAERYFYNPKGQLVGTIDNGAYLTELKYDLNGNLVSRRHYATPVESTNVLTFAELDLQTSDADLITTYTYTARNQVETETAPGGIVTRYTYDKLGKLIETRVGTGATRAQAERYDLQGRLTAELNAEGVAALATAKPEDVDGIWLRYGSRYTYNENGLRLTATDQLGNQSRYYYDGQGNLTYAVNAAGEVTGLAYNGFNQLKSKTNYGTRLDAATLATLSGGQNDANIGTVVGKLAAVAVDSVTRYEYDTSGHQTAVTDALGNRSTVHYDAFGRIDATEQQNNPGISAPAANPGGRNFYDIMGRLKASLTSGGKLTVYSYNSLSQLFDRVTYAKPVDYAITSANLDKLLAAPAAQLDNLHDSHQRFFYDERGLTIAVMTAEDSKTTPIKWAVVKNTYDGNGNLSTRTAYATALPDESPSPTPVYPADDAADSVTVYAYDSANRLAATATAQNTPDKANPTLRNWSVVRNTYDALGNLSATTAYATTLSGLAPTADALKNYAPADAANATTYYTYDSSNRIKTVAVAQNTTGGTVRWAVTGRTYDAVGNLRSVTQYATAQTSGSTLAYPAGAPAVDPKNDRTTSYRYDALNRVQVSIDAAGAVTRLEYDARGNVTQRIAYDKVAATPDSITAAYNPAPQPADRVTRTIYDLDNRPVYSIDALGQVTEQRYDAYGNVSSTLQYAAALKASQLATLTPLTADIKTLLTATPGVDRLTSYSYDQQGRLRYTVDAAGYLKETIYNTLGQVSATREYLALGVDANQQIKDKTVVVNTYDYDAMGNLVSSTDTLSNTEFYTYDGLGRKLTFKNKAGDIWSYAYDSAGHMVQETSPQVANYVANFNAAMGAWGSAPQLALITKLEYDMLGNLKSRTEASGTNLERTTTYRYDLVGRQTLTILAAANIYDDAADPKSITSAASFEKSSGDRITTVRYNTFGNAVYSQDAAGNISYKVYDLHGQVRYDVDAMGYVTGYARNTFGEVTDLTRYNTPAQAGSPTPDLLGAKDYANRIQPDANNDRTLHTDYDVLGRVIKSSEPLTDVYDQLSKTGPYIRAAKTTETAYDRYGQVRAQSVYGADDTGKRATLASETRSFYDLRGNLKAQVSALSASADGHTGRGYFTTYAYGLDGSNRTVTQTEYSQDADWNDTLANGGTPPGAAVDTNRTTKSVYDLANRLQSQSKVGAKFFRDGVEVTDNITTTYAYDKLGNQVLAVDALGGQVYTYYDKLGRVTAIAKAQTPGVPGITAAAPSLTEFKLDLLGNTAIRIDYANIYGGAPALNAPPTGDAANFDNRVTMTHYNLDGRAIEVLDPEQFNPVNPRPSGVPVSIARTSYDVLGRAAKQWRTVGVRDTASNNYTVQTAFQIARYDALGRLKESVTPALVDLVDNGVRPNVVRNNDYNAFGEVTATYITEAGGTIKQVSSTKYDQAGRAWFSNAADGIDTVTLFSAQGQATAQIRSTSTDQAKQHELATLGNAMAARDLAQQLRTDTQYDLLGNVIDSSVVNELNNVLVWFNGAWVKVQSSYDRPAVDSLIVIGQRDDAGKTIEVQYRLKPDGGWTAAGAERLQWLDGVPVFSTGGLASGDYEYQVKMTPVGGSTYQSRMGSIHIAQVDTTAKDNLIVALYLMLMGRAPDPATLNLWVAKYNQGATLTQLAGDMYATAEAVTLRGNDNGSAVKLMLATIGRPLPSDAGYQAKLDLWTAKLNQATTPVARGQVVRALFDDAGGALDVRAKAVTNYLVQGGSDADAATRLLTLAATAPDGAIAEGSRLAKAETQRVQLARLYLALFGRAPDKGGFDYWINDLINGKTLESIAQTMLQDKEAVALGLLPTLTPATYNERLVQLAYLNLLGRLPSPAELSTETAALGQSAPPTAAHAGFIVGLINRVANSTSSDPAAQAARTMLFNKVTVSLVYAATASPGLTTEQIIAANKAAIDAMYSAGTAADAAHKAMLKLQAMALAAQASADATKSAAAATPLEVLRLQLARVYAVVLNRAPDAGGYAYWIGVLKSGRPGTMLDIVNSMLDGEAQKNNALYPAGLSDKDFVTRVFNLGMGLQPGSAALASAVAAWVPAAASTTRGQLILNIINAVGASTRPDEQAMRSLLNNKAAVGITYALNFGANDLAQGNAILSRVTDTDISAAIEFGNSISLQALIDAALATSTAAATAATQATALNDGLVLVNSAQASVNTLQAAANGNALAGPLLRATQLYVAVLLRGAQGQPGLDLGGITAMSLQMRDGMTDVQAIQSMMDKTTPVGYDAGKFVKQFYVQALGLDPAKDPDGVAKWTAAAALPENRAQVIAGMLKSFLEDPIADSYAGKRDIQQAQAQFHNNITTVLGGLSSQIAKAESAYTIAKDASDKASSAAAAAKALSDANASNTDPKALAALELSRFYVGILNRGAAGQLDIDVGGLNFWTRAYIQGTDPVDIARQMLQTVTLPKDKVGFVQAMYQQVWGRDAGADSNRWVSKLINNSSDMGYASVAVGIIRELVNTPVSTELDYRLKGGFDTRVRDAMQKAALNAAGEATSAANDLSGKGEVQRKANQTLKDALDQLNRANGLRVDDDSRVVSAASLAATGNRLKNASELKPVVELMVILGMPTDFSSVYPAFLGTHTGDTIQKDVLAYAGLLSVKTDADRASFFRDLYVRMLHREPDVSPGKKWPDDNYWYATTSVGPNNPFDPVDKAFQFLAGVRQELATPTVPPFRGIAQRLYFPAEVDAAYTPLLAEINRRIENYPTVRQSVADSIKATQDAAKIAYDNAVDAVKKADEKFNYAWSYNEVAKVAGTTLNRALVVQTAAVTADVTAAASIAAKANMRAAALDVGLPAGATLTDFKTVADAATALRGAIDLVKSLETGRGTLANANVARTDAAQAAAGASFSKQVRAITEIFLALFNGAPSFLEFNKALGSLNTGKSLSEIADTAFADRQNVNSPLPGTNDAFVTTIYMNATGHAPDNATLRALSDPLSLPKRTRGTAVVAMISNLTTATAGADTQLFTDKLIDKLKLLSAQAQTSATPEGGVASLAQFIQANSKNARDEITTFDAAAQAAQTASAVYAKEITQLYLVLLGRSPEPAALAAGIGQRAGGGKLEAIAKGILDSAESRFPSSLSNYAFAEKLYVLGFNRPGAQSEINLSFAKLNNIVPREKLVIDLINDLSTYNGNDVAKTAASTSLNINVATSLERSVGETASFVSISQLAAQRSVSIENSALLTRMADGVVLGRDSVVDHLSMRNAASITRDRWGNVLSVTDARDRNYKVNYRYNTDNQQISQSLNARDTDANVPLRTTGYDALGRQVRSGDFVGNASGQFNRLSYDSNGNVVTEVHADGGVVTYTYDLFGNRCSVTTQLGGGLDSLRTNYSYDHLGHMLSSGSQAKVINYVAPIPGQLQGNPVQQLAAQQLTQYYSYDQLGRNDTRTDATGRITRSVYDLDGNVIATVNEENKVSLASYDARHHRIGSKDAMGHIMRWSFNAGGQLTSSTDMSNAVTTYGYDAAGQKIRQETPYAWDKQDISYVYENGLLVEVRDKSTHVTTRYTYDRVGNRLSEKQVYDSGVLNEPERKQDNVITYDMQNRVTTITDKEYKLSYEYDNNGNRTYVTSDFIEIIPGYFVGGDDEPNGSSHHDAHPGTWIDPVSKPRHMITYNAYDVMNRQIKVNWVVNEVEGTHQRLTPEMGANSHEITYDWAGNRQSDKFIGVKITKNDVDRNYTTSRDQLVTETYNYDEVGRLIRINRDGITINDRRYDQMGRLTETGILTRAAYDGLDKAVEAAGGSSDTHIYGYNNAMGRLMEQWDGHYNRDNPEDRGSINSNTWIGGEGYDAVGNLVSYEVRPARAGKNTKYTLTYLWTNGAKEESISVAGGATTISEYDVNGNRFQVSTVANGSGDRSVTTRLWYDADGHVQSKRDDKGDHFSLIVNGQVIGEETNSSNNVLGSSYAAVTSPALSAPLSTYSVLNPSETLRSIAQAIWGDSKLWYLIADANALSSDSKLETGRILRIPTRVNTLHNDYATFKPYDPIEAIGNTTPAMPPPSQGGDCGGMGAIVVMAVTIAVAYFTQQYYLLDAAPEGAAAVGTAGATGTTAAGTAGTAAAGTTGAAAAGTAGTVGTASIGTSIAAGALGGAAGSLAGQAVANLLGMQSGFDWKQIAMGAIGGGVSGGLSSSGLASNAIVRAAVGNALTQGIGVVIHAQPAFQWSGVAMAAASAAVTPQFNDMAESVGSNFGDTAVRGSFAQFARQLTQGVASGVVINAMTGGKRSYAQVATDAFGNALGSSLADSMRSTTTTPPRTFANSIGKDPSWMEDWRTAQPKPFDANDPDFNRILQEGMEDGQLIAGDTGGSSGRSKQQDTSMAGWWEQQKKYAVNNRMSLLNPDKTTIGGWLGSTFKSAYNTIIDGVPQAVEFLAEGAAASNNADRMGRTPSYAPDSNLGKFLSDEQTSIWEKTKILGISAMKLTGDALNGDPDAVGSILAGWGTSKLLSDTPKSQSLPRGFNQATDFREFSGSLYNGLESVGYNKVDAAFQGSSVTGRAHNYPNAPFDLGAKQSDFDIALGGQEIFDAAKSVGAQIRGTRTQPLSIERTPGLLEKLELMELSRTLGNQAGRPVNFMIYQTIDQAVARSSSIPVPRKK
ncbi:DUF4214 domain-containing protein [Duganella sp. HH105]|uniref:DUF4214 domain-containing protein n=1 Tax=Duganella sp. HH105 TaxID=1781067 RepID=UPI000877C8B2|nr:DUF4214 domain-containing protein [Duganella sp. HH105]OEZ54738.1 putative deoxyribonuclease RhsA [Duganella sp. HH105]